MIALSRGDTQQLPRGILRLQPEGLLGVMVGGLGPARHFGVKIVSVFFGNHARELPSHQGAVLLFEPETGALVAAIDATEITRVRTAAASAAATQVLARADSSRLAVLGYGEQAEAHVHAIGLVRSITSVSVWGRDEARRSRFAERLRAVGHTVDEARTPAEAAADADIICTATSAAEPILFGKDVRPGTHLNVVGSSFAGPAEIDNELVARSSFFADHRENVLAQGAEFQRAKAAGMVTDEHVVAEIGEVFAGAKEGRRTNEEITIYKSLGHIVQDLASASEVVRAAADASR